MECKRAYQALSDTKQRSRYDREQVRKSQCNVTRPLYVHAVYRATHAPPCLCRHNSTLTPRSGTQAETLYPCGHS